MRRALLAVVLLASACSGEENKAGDAASAAAVPEAPAAALSASAAPAVARSESVSNDLYEFEYSYPAAAAAIPDLRKRFDDDLEKQRRALIESAQVQLADSKKNGYPFNPLGSWTAWKVVTDLPGWLSLSAEVGSYEGGAHPNHGFDALLWDRQANAPRPVSELFTSEADLSRAIRPDFCRALDRQREQRRGEPVDRGSGNDFDQCIDPVESTIILGSSNGKAFDRIGVLVAPYAAGPYAEGDYEVTLPVTDAVLAAVKPGFRDSFARGR